jgi:hypothetical protein
VTFGELDDLIAEGGNRLRRLLGKWTLFFPDGELSGPPSKGRIVSIWEEGLDPRVVSFGLLDSKGEYWEVVSDFLILPNSQGAYET